MNKRISVTDKTVNAAEVRASNQAEHDKALESVKGKSYAELNAELEQVLARLQHDDIDIDDALETYKQGMVLVDALDNYLKDADNKINRLKMDFND